MGRGLADRHQVAELHERVGDLDEQRPGAPHGTDPGELEAAAEALLGYYLAGRRTSDELLREVEAAWAEYEELTQQQFELAMDRGLLAEAVPARWSTSGCRRRPTDIARRGGAGWTGRPSIERRLAQERVDVVSPLRQEGPGTRTG